MRCQALIAFVLACCGTNASAQIEWGVNGHPITAYPGISIADQLDLVQDLGMTSYRVNVSYVDQSDHLAAILEAARERDIVILPVLTPGGLDLDSDAPETTYKEAYDFAFALGDRFGDQILAWELGNEEENYAIIQPCEFRDDGTQYPCDWGPAGGVEPLAYYGPRWRQVSAILRGLSDGLEDAAPETLKAMGTAGWGHVGAFERMREDGIDWDISVWHMYGEDPEWAFEHLRDYNRPIWVTELNHPYGSQKDGEEPQAEGLVRLMARLAELSDPYKVEAVHIYQLLDEPYWAPSFEAEMGLVTMDPVADGWMIGRPKAAYHAVRSAIGNLRPIRECDPAEAAAGETGPAAQVSYGYCLVLRRLPDQRELDLWSEAIWSGEATPVRMIEELAGSYEFERTGAVGQLNDADYVSMLYMLLLDRAPDGQGIHTYTDQLKTEAIGRHQLATSLMSSSEFFARHPLLQSAVEADPVAGFNRQCDPETLPSAGSPAEQTASYIACLLLDQETAPAAAQWAAMLASGKPPVELIQSVLSSAVFAARLRTNQMSNEEYVHRMYGLLLGREADGQGYTDYVSHLNNGDLSRPEVAEALVASGEFAQRHREIFWGREFEPPPRECDLSLASRMEQDFERRVAYAHCLVLGSLPEPELLEQWSMALKERQASTIDLVVALLGSEAFAARYVPEDLPDPAFVTFIYRLLLEREPDGQGFQDYTAQLNAGELSKAAIARALVTSGEFEARHAVLAE